MLLIDMPVGVPNATATLLGDEVNWPLVLKESPRLPPLPAKILADIATQMLVGSNSNKTNIVTRTIIKHMF